MEFLESKGMCWNARKNLTWYKTIPLNGQRENNEMSHKIMYVCITWYIQVCVVPILNLTTRCLHGVGKQRQWQRCRHGLLSLFLFPAHRWIESELYPLVMACTRISSLRPCHVSLTFKGKAYTQVTCYLSLRFRSQRIPQSRSLLTGYDLAGQRNIVPTVLAVLSTISQAQGTNNEWQ